MRQQLIFGICLLLLGSSLAIHTLVTNEATIQLRGVEYPLSDSDLPFRVPRLGVNADLLQYPEGELNNQLALMDEFDIVWVRQFVHWDQIEVLQGEFDWSAYDTIAAAFQRYPTLQWIPVLYGTPTWATSPLHSYKTSLPPDDVQAFATFATRFAERYGNLVTYYQVWDDPNIFTGWGETPPQASQYVAMLAAAYIAIHSVDAQAQVIAAALAPTLEMTENNVSDLLYLNELYKLGLKDYSDAIAAKPYGFDQSPLHRENVVNTLNFSRVVALREIMHDHDDSATSLWLSEWGWNALPSTWQGDPSVWQQVTLDQQIAYTLEALERIETEWTYVGGSILSEWQPDEPSMSARWGFSLIGQDNKPSSLLTALQQVPKATILPSNGFYPVTHPSASYSGLWTFGELGADVGWLETSDSRFTFQFSGRDVGLKLREGNYVAFLYPQINGQPANTTQRDSDGNSYVFLRSNSELSEVHTVPIAKELALQSHTLTTIADKGWDQWALAGFVVSDGDLSLSYRLLQNVSLGAMFLATTALAVAGWQLHWRILLAPITKFIEQPASFLSQITLGCLSSFFLMIGLIMSVGDAMPQIIRRESIQYGLAILLSGGIVTLQPPVWLVMGACIVLLLILYRQPLIGVLLILGYAPFFLYPVELFIFAFPMTEVLILLTILGAMLHEGTIWARERATSTTQTFTITWNLNSLDVAVILLFPLGIMAYFVSPLKSPAITELRTLIVEPILVYLLARRYLSVQTLRYGVYAILIAACVLSVVGLGLFFTGQGIITAEGGSQRLTSVYGSPNNVALLLGRCIPFTLSLMLALSPPRKWVFVLMLLLFGITTLLTQSTGALFVGIPAGVITVFILYFGKRALLPVMALIGFVGVTAALLTQISPRVAKLLSFSEGTNFIRLRVWESTLGILQSQPLAGLGLDQFLYQYRGKFVKPDAIWDSNLNHPHNIILDFWIRLGILGLVWLLIVQWLFWSHVTKSLCFITDTTNRAILIGCAGSMMTILAHGLVDNSYFVIDLSLIFMFLLVIVSTFAHSTEN